MEGHTNFFKGKKITVVGLGLLGRGVGDVRFLAQCGADLIVTDLKTEEQLAPSLGELKEFKNIHYTLGRHELADFRGRDLIINGPAVPLDSPFIAEARRNNIPITMSPALFARFAREAGAALVGVTGTRGKSTTTYLIAEVLRSTGQKTILGGNVRGLSTLSLLPQADAQTVVVLELDSWLLQGFREEKLSPDIAVFTTLYPDHLNYYKNDMDAYLADKAEIFLHQKSQDTLILGEQCEKIIQEKYEKHIPSHVVVAYADDVPPGWQLKIIGEHNRENAACALFALRVLGISEENIQKGFEEFRGVPGRLELIGEARGIKVYNDNSSTTPDATIAALRALGDSARRRIVLIMGGDEKNLDMSELIAEIPKWCTKVILFKERGTQRIRDEVFAMETERLHIYEEEGIAACVARAFSVAEAGDIILYSPAFSSFGKYFKNEYDRGDQFVSLIEKLK